MGGFPPDFKALLDYTEWEREKWHQWLAEKGDSVLAIDAGPHGDGRFRSTGDLVRHIFSAEKRYVERLSGLPLTDTTSIPNDNIEALFQFGHMSRNKLMQFMGTLSDEKWDMPEEFRILDRPLTATPRKIVMHVLVHEVRHWAQISTLLRLNGLVGEFHDFLFSPILDADRGTE